MGPLEGIRVIEIAGIGPGPFAAMMLADLGAEIVRIDRADRVRGGDPARPPMDLLNRGRRSLAVDLKQPDGVAAVLRLVEQADALLEGFRPGVMERLGLGPDVCMQRNPRLIYGSISGFGQDGPYAMRAGVDQIAQGMGGLMSITGLPGQGPVRVGIPIADLSAGNYLAQGILLALLERERSGRGQWVHTSLLEAQIAMLDFQAARWLIDSEVPPQAGNNHPTGIPMGVFATADGAINIAAAGEVLWQRFLKAIEAPELAEDARYATGAERLAALNALADLGKRKLANTFTYKLRTGEYIEVKLAAARGLGNLGNSEGFDIALRALRFDRPRRDAGHDPPGEQIARVRQLAATALGAIRDRRALRALRKCLYESTYPHVQIAAADAILRILGGQPSRSGSTPGDRSGARP